MAQVRNLLNLEPPPLFMEVESALRLAMGDVDPAKQTEQVLRLSNHYVSSPDAVSPWKHSWAMNALLSYYHPLNQSRIFGSANRGIQRGFFEGLSSIYDFGCGTGAATLGLLAAWPEFESAVLSDHSTEVLQVADSIFSRIPSLKAKKFTWTVKSETLENSAPPINARSALAIFSYVLTEANAVDRFSRFLKRSEDQAFEAIGIFEPSTSADGRRLQKLRSVLQENGYHIWAPCTHSDSCPLLEESDRDWCHDRFPPYLPNWWKKLEKDLPMKNQTVTVSYLLARKTPQQDTEKMVRVTGDPLFEKTKVRQMICRGSHREFLSWFPSRIGKSVADFDLARGDLFKNDPSFWADQRGAERGHEYRIGEKEIFQIRDSVEALAIKPSK